MRAIVALVIVLIATVSGAYARRSAFGAFLEMKTYDFRFAFRDSQSPQDVPITIVGIDEPSLEKNPAPLMLWHRHFAEAIDGLVRGGAAVIGIDFLFSDITTYDPEGQQALSASILKAAAAQVPIVFGYRVLDAGVEQPPNAILMPARAVQHPFGYLNLTTDDDDFVRRQEIRSTASDGTPEPGFALAAATAFAARTGQSSAGSQLPDVIHINFREPRHFPRESFGNILDGLRNNDDAYLKSTFGGRIVLIGRLGERGDEDLHSTPHYYWRRAELGGGARRTPGIEIHANTMTTLLADGPILEQSPISQTFVNFITAALLTLCCFVLQPIRGALISIGLLAVIAYVAFVAAFAQGFWIQVVPPMAAGAVAIGLTQTANFVLEGREKRRLRHVFNRYVNDKVIDKILLDSDQVVLHGMRMPVAVLFADIKGFTTRAEKSPAEEVVQMLNDYFTGVIEAIQSHSGMVNSLMGDGLMAIFGAPLEDPKAPNHAIDAGKEMLNALVVVNERLKQRHVAPIEIGIGIHYGEAIIGNMGSPRKMEYTAIGDVVNTASRIEGLTRKVNGSILITGETYDAAGKPSEAEFVGEFEVKGRDSRVSIYRIS